MTFDISMGVRRTDKELKGEVESALSSLAPQINGILHPTGVPVVWEMQTDPWPAVEWVGRQFIAENQNSA
jgi:hypothetical protein